MSDSIDQTPSSSCDEPVERLLDASPPDAQPIWVFHSPSTAAAAFDEAMIASLEERDFRVLRRVRPLGPAPAASSPNIGIAIGLDLETTGLSFQADEVVELAMVRVRYDLRTGRLLGTEGTFCALREPSIPLPDAVSRLTKIDPSDLVGQTIDPVLVENFTAGARLVFAHNASFDRRFAEAAWPVFTKLPWACSLTDIDWSELQFEGGRLAHLVMQSGHFHDGHRAADDVFAMLHCLQLEVPSSGSPAFKSLLENARMPTARVWADGASFAKKDHLKTRGYRWSAGDDGAPRAWYRDVCRVAVDEELAFLRDEILDDQAAAPRVVPITAFDRYSIRAGMPASRSGSQ